MKSIKTLLLSASVLAIGLSAGGINNPAQATQGTSKFVKDVDMLITGYAPAINIKNISGKKDLDDLNLKIQESNIQFTFNGSVDCKNNASLAQEKNKVYFGSVNLSNDAINTSSTLYVKGGVYLREIDENIVESGDNEFTVPLNQIKNGHPALRVDPLAELEKARQAFNGTDLDFYQHDREIVLLRPLSVSGVCMKKTNFMKSSSGYETHNGTIQIKYKGDPTLTDMPAVPDLKINAQKANNPDQIQQNPDLVPFQLNKVEFAPGIQNYVGKCLPTKNPKIRLNFQESGGKTGLMDLRVKAVSNQYADYGYYFETQGIIHDPKNNSHLDFSFPLKEILSQHKYSWMTTLNKTYSHNMSVEVRHKNMVGGNWSQWKEYDTAVFKHRCVPQLNGKLQGLNNGTIGGYTNGEVPVTVKPILGTKPKPAPIGSFKVQPVPAPKPKRATLN